MLLLKRLDLHLSGDTPRVRSSPPDGKSIHRSWCLCGQVSYLRVTRLSVDRRQVVSVAFACRQPDVRQAARTAAYAFLRPEPKTCTAISDQKNPVENRVLQLTGVSMLPPKFGVRTWAACNLDQFSAFLPPQQTHFTVCTKSLLVEDRSFAFTGKASS